MTTAVFGGGCFWCTEAVFSAGGGSAYGGKIFKGIVSVLPGYAGGRTENPTYEQVCSGTTGHAEVTRVEYDPSAISYSDLLTVFFASHDPTMKDRQGNDVGTQYRSVIFYTIPEQQKEAHAFIQEINASDTDGKSIVTTVEPLKKFYVAENYHHDYFAKNPGNPYCERIINPKLQKVKEHFATLLRENK